jgi:agmatinase
MNMNDRQPPFSGIRTFLGLEHRREAVGDRHHVIAGIPFDLGTSNRCGQRLGPAAVRDASMMLIDNDNPRFRIDPTGSLRLVDWGDFDIALGDKESSLSMIENQARACPGDHLIAIGGDHTISLPLLRALKQRCGPLALVHFDAHLDTWPENFGARPAHGTPIRHAIEERLISPRHSLQIGIRSPVDNDVMDWTLDQGLTVITAEAVHFTQPADIVQQIVTRVGQHAAYLSLDIDVLDPSQAPGVGTPEIGGLWSWQLVSILNGLSQVRWRGMDCVEVVPAYDSAQITALAAATFIWIYLSMLAFKK